MPAQLLALSDGPSLLLDKPIMLFGRHPECDVQLNSRKVSRRHCCIAQVSEYLVVRDLGSTNGVRINGVRVIEGRLKNGDELTIGNFRYQVCWDAALHGERLGANGVNARPNDDNARPAAVITTPDENSDPDLESADQPIPLDDVDDLAPPARPAPGGRPPRPPSDEHPRPIHD